MHYNDPAIKGMQQKVIGIIHETRHRMHITAVIDSWISLLKTKQMPRSHTLGCSILVRRRVGTLAFGCCISRVCTTTGWCSISRVFITI